MVFTRKYKSRRNRRKIGLRRKSMKRRVPRSLSNAVCSFTSKRLFSTLSGVAGGSTQYGSYAFSFSDLVANASAYTTLFDSYRISKIKITFIYRLQNLAYMPQMYIVTDHDDASAPTSVAAVSQRSNSRLLTWSTSRVIQTHTYVPAFNTALQANPGGTTISPVGTQYRPWVDSAFSAIPTFGVKYALMNLVSGDQIDVNVQAWFQCKNTV